MQCLSWLLDNRSKMKEVVKREFDKYKKKILKFLDNFLKNKISHEKLKESKLKILVDREYLQRKYLKNSLK